MSPIYINTTRGVLWHLGTIRKSVAWARNFRPYPPLSESTFPPIFPHNIKPSSPTFFPRDHMGGTKFFSFFQELTILFVLVCAYYFLPFIILPKLSQKLYISFWYFCICFSFLINSFVRLFWESFWDNCSWVINL